MRARAAAGLIVSSLIAGEAAADVGNRNLLPVGERESALANAGITSASGAAAFYNPANLARIGQPSISMTGTTMLRFDLKTDALFIVNGIDQPFESSGLLTIPASLASTYDVAGISVATSVMVPDAYEIRNRATFQAGPIRSSMLQNVRNQDLWIGISGAHSIGDNLYAGVSVFGTQRSYYSLISFQVVDETVPDAASQSMQIIDTQVMGVTSVAGVYWQAHPTLGVGARIQSPLLQITGSADLYQSTVVTGETNSVTEFEAEDTGFNDPLPWDAGVGLSFRPTPRLEILVDANLQFAEAYDQFDDPTLGDSRIQLEAAPRLSVASEIGLARAVRMQLGARYNDSATPAPREDGEVRENYFGATAGLSWEKGRTRSGIGAFFFQSKGELLPAAGGTGETVDSRTRLIGALITVSYRL